MIENMQNSETEPGGMPPTPLLFPRNHMALPAEVEADHGPTPEAEDAETGAQAPAMPPTVNNVGLAKLAPNVASDQAYGYYKLDAAETKAEFDMLDAELSQRFENLVAAIVTWEEAMPYIDKMQKLLSQRGAERYKILKEAGLPTWTEWAKGYAEKLRTSFRTMQRRISELRGGGKRCLECGEEKADCTCPVLCARCGKVKTDCACAKVVAIPEPYLRALERLMRVADHAADQHADQDLAEAVKYATCGMSRQEKINLGIQPKPRASGDEDSSLAPETVIDIFLTLQVRREFLTAVTSETELFVILREMTRLFYDSNHSPESERSIKIEGLSPSAPGQKIEPAKTVKPKAEDWTPERRQAHGERIKAGIARKPAAQAAPSCAA